MRLFDLAYQWNSDNLRDRRRRADDDRSPKRGLCAHNRTSNGLHFFHDSGGMCQHFTSGVGDLHASTMSIKQVGADLLFQQSNLPTKRRLGNVKTIRGLAETAQFGNMNQGFELNDIHYQASQHRARRDMRRKCCECNRICAPWNAPQTACRAASRLSSRLYPPARRGCTPSYKIQVYQLGLPDGLLPS
ncbi:hypothetical protein D3C87_1583770 [compost metagenome]